MDDDLIIKWVIDRLGGTKYRDTIDIRKNFFFFNNTPKNRPSIWLTYNQLAMEGVQDLVRYLENKDGG